MPWQELAECLGDDSADWMGDDMTVECAAACLVCRVRLDCLGEAMPRDRHWDAGIWGGTTVIDRDRIRTGKASVADVWQELERTVKEVHGGGHGDMDYPSGLLSLGGA
jgi:hypothetical protein